MTDFRDKDPTQLKNKMKTKEKRKLKVSIRKTFTIRNYFLNIS